MFTSCIITCFNYENFVRDAIVSACSQTVSFDEIIVVDDASADRSQQVISQIEKEYPNVTLLRHDVNKGQLAAFESGVLRARGELICFLDADDVYAPHYLETALSVYKQNKD